MTYKRVEPDPEPTRYRSLDFPSSTVVVARLSTTTHSASLEDPREAGWYCT